MDLHTPVEFTVLATAALAVLLSLYYLLKLINKTDDNTTKRKPPEPSNKWPIIGHLHLLKGLPHISLGKLADKYGPIFMIKLGVKRVLVVNTADMAKACLRDNKDTIFLNRPQKIFVKHAGYDSAMFAFSPYGEYWREIRKIITVELLSNHRIEMFKSFRVSQIRSVIKEISGFGSDESVDMKQWFNDISMNIIVRLVSGKSLKEMYQGEEYHRCSKALREFFELASVFVPGDLFPYLRWFDIGGHEKQIKKVAKDMDDFAQRWLEEHKQTSSSIEKDGKQDLMDVMLDVFGKGKQLPSQFETHTIIKSTCMAMILAATDTTAVTLTWALSLLLNNKEALKKTQAELDNFIGKERIVEESDLKNLVYLQAVLKETMRLYPAAPLSVPREAISDCTVSGYHIPVDTQLFVNLYKIHRDPQVFEDPLSFNPERFLTTCKDYDVRGQNYEYMPFGSGRRICPGISFALQMMQLTLASLLHGFEISNALGETVDMTEGFGLTNLKVTPLDVVLTHRLPKHLYYGF